MAAPNMMLTPDRSKPFVVTVRDVNAFDRLVHGEDMFGAAILAYYYEGAPGPGDLVVVEQMANSGGKPSFFVCAGTSSYGAVFGTGGDGAITLTANTAAAAARTTSADGACSSESTTVTSATGAFTDADVGSIITSTSLSIGRTIVSRNSSTSVEVNHPLWVGSAMTGEALTITPPIPYTKSGSVFTLQRNLYCTTLSLVADDGAFTLNTNGFQIFCNQLFYVGDGIVVHNDGSAASGRTAGAGGIANVVGGGGAGGAGFNNSGGTAGAGTTAGNITGSIATMSATAVCSGGGGGGASTGGPTKSNFSPPSTIINAFTNGLPGSVPQAITLLLNASTTKFQGGSGGSGGCCVIGGVGARSTGGGGGGGGGVVMIAARQIQNVGGTIRSNGGAGGAGAITVASGFGDACGGGGGGGGGAVVLIYGTAGSSLGAVYALGGAAGGGTSGGSTGGVGITQYVDTISYAEGFPRRVRQLVTVSAGGAGGASASANGGVGTNGQNGQSGLVWAIPI